MDIKLLTGGQLAKKKRYVVAGVAVVTALAAYLTGEANLVEAIRLAATAILGM